MFTITLTEQELSLIGNALGNLPFNQVFQLITKIQSQVEKKVGKPKKSD